MDSLSHQLENSWTLWIKPNAEDSSSTWVNSFKSVYKVNTIENFWKLWNNVPTVDKIPSGTIYAFFKENITPTWEDTENSKGCSYTIYMTLRVLNIEKVKELIQTTILTLIGATLENEELITGIVIDKKYNSYKLSLWFREPKNEKVKDLIHTINKILSINGKKGFAATLLDHQTNVKDSCDDWIA